MRPHRYTSTITRVARGLATIDAPPRAPLMGGPPPVLHGDPANWSPEHLLVSALGLCLFATFDAFAAREKISVLECAAVREESDGERWFCERHAAPDRLRLSTLVPSSPPLTHGGPLW